MNQTQQNTCPIDHCGKPSPTTTICHDCAEDVHRALYQFLNVELERLHAIALGEERTAEKVARQNHDRSSSQDVLDLSTLELHTDITKSYHFLGLLAHVLAVFCAWCRRRFRWLFCGCG